MVMECYNMAMNITLEISKMVWCMEMVYGKTKKDKNL